MACHHPGKSNFDLVPSINSPGMLVQCRGRIEGNASCNAFPSSLAFVLLKELKWNCCGVECVSRVVDVLSTAGEVYQFICLQWRKCYRANLFHLEIAWLFILERSAFSWLCSISNSCFGESGTETEPNLGKTGTVQDSCRVQPSWVGKSGCCLVLGPH